MNRRNESLFLVAKLIVCLWATIANAQDDYYTLPPLPSRYRSFEEAKAGLPKDLSNYHPVNVTIFFESLCPDSSYFFQEQVYPTVFNHLIPRDLFILRFAPYGHATTHHDSSSKKYIFNCQHGPAECEGNIAEICFAYLVRNTDRALTYFNCVFEKMERAHSIKEATSDCARSLTSGQAQFDSWEKCQKSRLGQSLHAIMGERTKSLYPKVTFIPWTVFDSEGSRDINNKALYELPEVILRYWYKRNMPSQYY